MEYIDGDNVAWFAYRLQLKSLTDDAPLTEENVEILGSVVGCSLFFSQGHIPNMNLTHSTDP